MNHIVLNSSPEVLYCDQWLYIVHKEREELAVPGRGDDKQECLMSRAAQWLGPVFNVHRLDQPTTGLLILARSVDAQREMSHLFEKRLVEKIYRARVKGKVRPEEGVITLPIRPDRENRPRQVVDTDNGKEAETHWKVICTEQGWTEVELYPRTGRTHQLRVHLASIGHPILGDRLYNEETAPELMGQLCLHAASLRFMHPFTDKLIFVEKKADFPDPD